MAPPSGPFMWPLRLAWNEGAVVEHMQGFLFFVFVFF